MPFDKEKRLAILIPVILAILGTLLTSLSLLADWIGLDLTPGFGIVQMTGLLLGLAFLTMAAFIHIHRTRRQGAPRSLQADIGLRLGATGVVFAFVAGFSDLVGIGTHITPQFTRPYVGPLQLGGIALGIVLIIAGIILYYTSRTTEVTSSLGFLIKEEAK